MAAYARIYGFRTFGKKDIRGREDEFTYIDANCYVSNGDFAVLEEIIENEF